MSILGISRVDPRIQKLFQRTGIAYIMSGVVEVASIGKMTTDWRMTAVHMSDARRDLRVFLDQISHQKPRVAHHGERAYATIAGAVAVAQGAVEVASLGKLTTNWTMMWMCYGDEIIEKTMETFKRARKQLDLAVKASANGRS